jgi:hypothetical protein
VSPASGGSISGIRGRFSRLQLGKPNAPEGIPRADKRMVDLDDGDTNVQPKVRFARFGATTFWCLNIRHPIEVLHRHHDDLFRNSYRV